jgi:(p)ppGpp synthase/HD superfamily hydrolase
VVLGGGKGRARASAVAFASLKNLTHSLEVFEKTHYNAYTDHGTDEKFRRILKRGGNLSNPEGLYPADERFQWKIAVELAVKYHEGQMYGAYPYVKHLMDVDALILTKCITPLSSGPFVTTPRNRKDKLRAAVWLHDIIEDTFCTVEDLLAAGICQDVVDAVVLLTKTEGYVLKDYLEAIILNPIAREVKLRDSQANKAQSIKEASKGRVLKYTHQEQVLLLGKWFERIK